MAAMRVTVEIPKRQGDQLRRIAASRGQRGVSKVVEEAIGRYLESVEFIDEAEYQRRAQDARAVLGSWSEAQAEAFRRRVHAARRRWR